MTQTPIKQYALHRYTLFVKLEKSRLPGKKDKLLEQTCKTLN